MRPRLRIILSLLILTATLVAGARPLGPLPPLGPLLEPAGGVWAVATTATLPARATRAVAGLGAAVRVAYDSRGVPHIFAATEADAYRALGFVVARDRLFQMELQARAGGGTLTELVGARALDIDRDTDAIGLPRAARRIYAALDPASSGRQALDAYADGVNAYLASMRAQDLPLEYHLLGRRPTRWSPVDALYVFGRMGLTLASGGEEFRRLAAISRVGRRAADALFPVDSPIQEPIQPTQTLTRRVRAGAGHLPLPGAPDTAALALLGADAAALRLTADAARDGDRIGSNNWAVSPARTAAGHALLAGDPHLDLTLPSIWYEAHLVVAGRLDVYGVTIPGMPGVVLGFNRDVAWSFTNTGADVMDSYLETVDDQRAPTRYRVDAAWRAVTRELQTYHGPRGERLAIDTLRFTHRGPLRLIDGRWLSTRWTVLESGAEIGSLIDASRARSVGEWQQATARYAAPAQNMLVADRRGTIAIRATGRYPIRPDDGRGDRLRDGSTSASDWRGAWPLKDYPQATDPTQGYLASANQQPVDPAVEPRYLGTSWPPPWRALRINALLRADSAMTPDAMRRMQTDPGSARADRFVPAFLSTARAHPADSALAHAAALLAEWDRRYARDNRRAVLFEVAMDELARATWDELAVPGAGDAPFPDSAVLSLLLDDPTSVWWDKRATPDVIEQRDDVLGAALVAALGRTVREHGAPDGAGWRWDQIRHARIMHLLGLPSLSAPPVAVPGGPSTISPSSGLGTEGASWRMVVELGPVVRAWGTYPGGQSGNPVSPRYLEHLGQWANGGLDSLQIPHSVDELRSVATLQLTPAR